MTRNAFKDESPRMVLRPPVGNNAFYSREYLATVRSCVVKAWPASGPNSIKREVALTLLADPDLRLRVCHLEELLRARQLTARPVANGCTLGNGGATHSLHSTTASPPSPASTHHHQPNGTPAPRDLPPPIQLQTALADPSFAALFVLDPSVNDPDWGMQVLWLNMVQLQKELALPAPPPPPPSSTTQPPSLSPHAQPPTAVVTITAPSTGPAPDGGSPPPLPQPPLPLVPDPTLLHLVAAAFPNHPTDEEDYVAVAAAFCLSTYRDPKALLPPLSLHLTDLTTHLCACAAVDGRLAAALQRAVLARGGVTPTSSLSLAAAVGEALAAPRLRIVFRQSESLSRKGERVVSLAVENLARNSSGGNTAAAVSMGGSGLPFDAWHRANTVAAAAAAACTARAPVAGGHAAGDGLPVFLFEYEAPSDVYGKDDRASPLAARRDQFGYTPSASPGTAFKAVATAAGDGAAAAASPRLPPPQSAPSGFTPHVWSDGARSLSSVSTSAATAATTDIDGRDAHPPHAMSTLHLAASEPAPLPDMPLFLPAAGPPPPADAGTDGHVAALSRRSTEPTPRLNDATAAAAYGYGPGVGHGVSAASVEGASPRGTFSGVVRHSSLYDTHIKNGSGMSVAAAAAADALFQHTFAAAAAAAAPPSMLSASPGGPGGELHVPQEIADVWSNAGFGARGGGGGGGTPGTATRQGSMVAHGTQSASGLPGDGPLGGIFSMSPTQEQPYIWERVAQRTGAQPAAASGGAAANMGRAGTIDLSSYMLGYGNGNAGGSGVGDASGHGNFVVGSAPPGLVPPFLSGGGAAGGFAGVGSLGNGAGMVNGGAATFNGLLDYVSWHSSSADLSSSVGGRSAPVDDAPGGSWLLAHGPRAAGGCGGGSSSTARVGAVDVAAGSGAGGGAATALRDGGTGPSPSMSEESEEAASVVGGLDLDPVALTLEFIGFDPLDPTSAARRALLTPSTANAAAAAQTKGLIAAAAAPRAPDSATAAPVYGTATQQSAKSFAAAAASAGGPAVTVTVDGASPHSSLDSSDALTGGGGGSVAGGGGGGGATVLTGWSAMAARGPALPPAAPPNHSAAAAAAGLQLAAAAAAAGGGGGSGRLVQSNNTAVVQGLAATMAAAMNAAAAGGTGGGSGAAAAMLAMSPRSGALGLTAGSMMGLSAGGGGGVVAARDLLATKPLHPKLTPRLREEIFQLVRTVPGLKAEDFDDGVLHQLTLKKSEEEAVGALRTLAAENLSGIQHMAAYINHIIKNYHLTTAANGAGAVGLAAASLPSATVRANSTPVSSKAILQKLPLRVYRRLEDLINKCSYMEWKHFDAGVVKVMAQLAEIGEEDVFEELELLKSTDLSNVEYMPAYLNKRLNNRLWSRRKMLTSAAAAVGAAAGAAGGP